jgi:hypothetical protein
MFRVLAAHPSELLYPRSLFFQAMQQPGHATGTPKHSHQRRSSTPEPFGSSSWRLVRPAALHHGAEGPIILGTMTDDLKFPPETKPGDRRNVIVTVTCAVRLLAW